MSRFNRFLSFNPNNGLLITQSGVLLNDIITTFLSKGWFLHVTLGLNLYLSEDELLQMYMERII